MDRKDRSKITIALFIGSLIVVLTVSVFTRMLVGFSVATMEDSIGHRLNVTAGKLAKLATLEELDRFQSAADMDTPEYREMRQRLFDFSQRSGVLYAYYIRNLGGYNFQYIVDNDFNKETQVGLDSPVYTIYDEPMLTYVLKGQIVHSGVGLSSNGWEGLLTSYAPIFDADGNVAAVAGVDIEDLHMVRAVNTLNILFVAQFVMVAFVFVSGLFMLRSFKQEARAAEHASEVKSQFLSSLSHEISVPLDAINNLSAALMKKDFGAEDNENVRLISQAGKGLSGMIEKLFELSKFEGKKK